MYRYTNSLFAKLACAHRYSHRYKQVPFQSGYSFLDRLWTRIRYAVIKAEPSISLYVFRVLCTFISLITTTGVTNFSWPFDALFKTHMIMNEYTISFPLIIFTKFVWWIQKTWKDSSVFCDHFKKSYFLSFSLEHSLKFERQRARIRIGDHIYC